MGKIRNWFVGKAVESEVKKQLNNLSSYKLPGTAQEQDALFNYRLMENQVWSRGNRGELVRFYAKNPAVPKELGSSTGYPFWEGANELGDEPKVHFPTGILISNTMTALLFGKEIETKINSKNSQNNEDYQKVIDNIKEKMNFEELLQESAHLESYSGTLAWRPVVDNEIGKDPFFVPYPAERVEFTTKYKKVVEIIFIDHYKHDKKSYELRSIHGKGYINYMLFEEEKDKKKEQVPIETLEETAFLKNAVFVKVNGNGGREQVSVLMAVYKKNRTISHEFPETVYGGSDYEGLIDVFHLIDETYSVLNSTVRVSRPTTYMPKSLLEETAHGHTIIPKMRKTGMVITLGVQEGENKGRIEIDRPEVDFTPFNDALTEQLKKVAQVIGIAPVSLGVEAVSADSSGASLEMREKNSIITRENKIKLWRPFLRNAIRLLMLFSSIEITSENENPQVIFIKETFEDLDVDIRFSEYAGRTNEELTEKAIKLLNAGIIDQTKAVDIVFTDEEIPKEDKEKMIANAKLENIVPMNEEEIKRGTLELDE